MPEVEAGSLALTFVGIALVVSSVVARETKQSV